MSVDQLFAGLLAQMESQSGPPVEQWHPQRTGQIDIRIDRDGRWFHDGRLIKRERMVKVFATILRRDPDGYVLVTPAEKLYIEVEDVPFVALDCDVRRDSTGAVADLLFTTNVGDLVLAGAEHPIWLSQEPEATPYIRVRHRLDARINRPVYYRLLDHMVVQQGRATLRSNGAQFALGGV